MENLIVEVLNKFCLNWVFFFVLFRLAVYEY